MKTKIFSAVIVFLFLPSIGLSQEGSKADFSWNQKSKYETIEKVRFETGETAVIVSNQELPPYQRLREICAYKRLEIGKEGNRLGTNACDSRVSIRAAFPSASNAKIAIVETNCGGTMCNSYNDIYILFLERDGLQITKVGTSFYSPKDKPTIYDFWFDGKKIKRSVIHNFFDGQKNELGDLIESTRNYIIKGWYIDSRFKKEYVKFIGEHPDTFMGDSFGRADILKVLKPEEFREYRNAMSGPGSSSVTNGRFVVMNACMAHNCNDIFASVVIDGFTGDTQLIRFEKTKSIFVSVSTKPLDPKIDDEWLEDVDTQDWVRISINKGKLDATKK